MYKSIIIMLNRKLHKKSCHRYNIAGNAHELTFSCYKSQPFLSKERTCRYLIDSINTSKEKHQFDIWAYVFMPNHVHLLICPQHEQYSIPEILQSIKQPVSRKAITYLKINNPSGLKYLATFQNDRPYHFWQKGGGYDRNITKDKTIINIVRYIHNNPVRKNLIDTPEKWPYSSAADWQDSRREGPIQINFDSFPVT
ncbi:MAG: transposase [Sedimentisphaerales bacterium]|nr:transposase [Sedimentisphaerales bacterium]